MTARLLVACLALPLLAAAADPPEVSVASPILRELIDFIELTGRVEPVAQVEIRARVSGYLEKVAFTDGAEVQKGDLLFEIDPRPYQAELKRVEAQLAAGEARLKQAAAEAARARALLEKNAIGRDEYEKILAARAAAEAEVAAARAAVEVARIQLDYTSIRAPITGRIGRRALDPGNLARADETALATIVAMDPVHVVFPVDERTLVNLRERKVGEGAAVQIARHGEKDYPHAGKIDFVDNRIDPATATIAMRATLPNEDGVFVPGMVVRVRLIRGKPYQALLLPAGAARAGRDSVFVVGDKNVVEARPLVLGGKYEGEWTVEKGLTEKDRVVVGMYRDLEAGMVVKPVPAKKP